MLRITVERAEIEKNRDKITLLNDDPDEIERRWVGFDKCDKWAEQFEREELGQLYDLSDG